MPKADSKPVGNEGKIMNYHIVVHKDPDSDYGVTVPDLPGCFSAGDTLEQAIENSKEAITCHLEGLLRDNDPIPETQSLELHQRNPDYVGGIWLSVSVDFPAQMAAATSQNRLKQAS